MKRNWLTRKKCYFRTFHDHKKLHIRAFEMKSSKRTSGNLKNPTHHHEECMPKHIFLKLINWIAYRRLLNECERKRSIIKWSLANNNNNKRDISFDRLYLLLFLRFFGCAHPVEKKIPHKPPRVVVVEREREWEKVNEMSQSVGRKFMENWAIESETGRNY